MYRHLFLAAALAASSFAHAQTTVNVPAQSCSAVITCQGTSITIPASSGSGGSTGGGSGSGSGGSTSSPPPSGVTWMYLNGVKTLAGDFTGNGESTNYQHATSAGYNGGTKDILITSSVPWGYFIPYWAGNYRLPNPGYTYLLLAIKPSKTGDTFGMHAERVGDAPLPGIELVTASGNSYGPPAVAGKWGVYKVPLSDLGVYGDATLYKVVIATHTDSADSWEMDAIGFQ